MYNQSLGMDYEANTAYTAAFDAIWTIAQALNYTEQMRLQTMTENGTLTQTNCTDCAELHSADPLSDIQQTCSNVTENPERCVIEKITNCTDLYGELVYLNEFNYSNAFMGCVIRYNFHQVNFSGMAVSGILSIITLSLLIEQKYCFGR